MTDNNIAPPTPLLIDGEDQARCRFMAKIGTFFS